MRTPQSVIFAWTGFAVHKKSKHAKDLFNLSTNVALIEHLFEHCISGLVKIEFEKWATIIMFFKIHYLISGGLLGTIFTLFIIVTPLTT